MKDTIPYVKKSYCDGCEYKDLEVTSDRLYMDNTVVVNSIVQCRNAELCEQLWNHLLDYDETNDDEDDDDDDYDDMFEDDDWTYSTDATYEDIH